MMVAHICNANTPEAEAEKYEFEASVCDIVRLSEKRVVEILQHILNTEGIKKI